MISDPDCTASGTAIPTICSSNGYTCVGYGTSPTGQPRSYIITPTSDGGTQVQTFQQRTVGGATVVDTTTVTVSPAGVVTGVSGGTQTGNIPAPSTSAPAGSPASVSPSAGGTTVAPTAPATTAPPITFPNDYARQGEAQTAANTITPKLDTLHHDLTDTVTTTDPTLPTVSDMPTWGNTFDGLLGWQLPGHSSVCPKPTLDLSGVLGAGKVFTMDSQCALIQDHFGILQAAMVVVWSIIALFIVLGA
jgi:hypothetical protein